MVGGAGSVGVAAALLLQPDSHEGIAAALVCAVATAVTAELLRGVMTVTTVTGYRVTLPVQVVAAACCLGAVLGKLPGSGEYDICRLPEPDASWFTTRSLPATHNIDTCTVSWHPPMPIACC